MTSGTMGDHLLVTSGTKKKSANFSSLERISSFLVTPETKQKFSWWAFFAELYWEVFLADLFWGTFLADLKTNLISFALLVSCG